MPQQDRREDEQVKLYQPAPERVERDEHDEPTTRREQWIRSIGRGSLTANEREERWPIG